MFGMVPRTAAGSAPDLLRLMASPRRRRAAAATAALADLWRADPEPVWHAIWAESPVPPAALDFLLAPDDTAPARLLTGLSVAAAPAAGELVTRPELAAFLRETDDPALVEALLRHGADTLDFGLALANPHAARAAAEGPPDRTVLLVLAGRPHDVDPQRLVDTLLHPWPPAVRAACDGVLESLPPGPAREALCERALDEDPAALAAVVTTGLRPEHPDEAAFFLLATRQWQDFTAFDPQGRRLYAYCHATAFARPDRARRTVDVLLHLDEHAPAAARTAATEALHQAKAQAREYLCTLAIHGDPDATRIVTAAGHTPKDRRDLPAFLFLTAQWQRYDATDPDGSRLRAYTARLPPWDTSRNRLRAAARRAGRPAPCDAPVPWEEPAAPPAHHR
nr:hypothetical protein GCM10020063_060850 [Dactylosporangium thailandense]